MVKTPFNIEEMDQQLLADCKQLFKKGEITQGLLLLRKANYSRVDSM